MNSFVDGYIEKLAKRPLLVPSLVLFIILSVYCSLVVKSYELPYGEYSFFVNRVQVGLDGSRKTYASNDETGRVIINTDAELYPGDTISITCKPQIPDEGTNPGAFNYRSHLKTKGVGYVIWDNNGKIIKQSRFGKLLLTIRYFVRDKVFGSFEGYYDERDTSLLAALCLGDTSLADDSIIRDFRLSDCSHLLAVSGTHFSSFMIVCSFCLRKLGRKKKNVIQTGVILITGFLTGWTESVTRSAFMSLCGLNSRDNLSGLCFAALVMMLSDPFAVRSQGFLMSFGAALGIRYLAEPINNRIKISVISATLASKAALIPFYLENGLSLGLGHLLVQILALFTVKGVCLFFVPGVILSFISPIFYYPSVLFARLTSYLTSKGAEQYFDTFTIKGDIKLLVGIIIMFLAYRFLKEHKIIVISLFAAFCILLFIQNYDPSDKVVFLDVGQGDSCLIMSRGKSVLIDGGTTQEGSYVLPDVLDHYKIKSVDIAIITHFDEDHAGGVLYLQDEGRVKNLIRSGDDMLNGDYLSAGNACLKAIWPDKAVDGNPGSVVTVAEVDGVRILLTGDIDIDCENQMIDRITDIDILKVAHHGSKYSSSLEFLEKAKPEIAVISVALDNDYGHPAPEVLDRLGEVEAKIYQTSKNGSIIVTIKNHKYEISCFKES